MRLLPRLTERKLCPPALNPRSSDRRQFLEAAAGLVLGFWLPQRSGRFAKAQVGAEQRAFEPDAFVRVAPDNIVTIISKHCEAGQGIHTGLATILAEELDADWAQVRVEPAPADRALYKNLQFGSQATGGGDFHSQFLGPVSLRGGYSPGHANQCRSEKVARPGR